MEHTWERSCTEMNGFRGTVSEMDLEGHTLSHAITPGSESNKGHSVGPTATAASLGSAGGGWAFFWVEYGRRDGPHRTEVEAIEHLS